MNQLTESQPRTSTDASARATPSGPAAIASGNGAAKIRSADPTLLNVNDYRERARRRLPRMVFDLVEGGAGDEYTRTRNEAAFEALRFMPRVLQDVSQRSQETTLFGQKLASPLLAGPAGMHSLVHHRGEIATASAALREGCGMILSHASGYAVEEVIAESGMTPWFQMYVDPRGREYTGKVIDRVKAAGCPVLVLTIDCAVLGRRERDVRNGMSMPPRITWRNAVDVLAHANWLMEMARGPGSRFGNFSAADSENSSGSFGSAAVLSKLFINARISWDDITWVRSRWQGPLVLKGILNPLDAMESVNRGADGIVVSNHGGRQLDNVPASIEVLPRIVDAVKGRCEILMDGGIRRGSDVVRALALGASACLIARPLFYGLAVDGQAGVESIFRILKTELDAVLALLGKDRIDDLKDVIFDERHDGAHLKIT